MKKAFVLVCAAAVVCAGMFVWVGGADGEGGEQAGRKDEVESQVGRTTASNIVDRFAPSTDEMIAASEDELPEGVPAFEELLGTVGAWKQAHGGPWLPEDIPHLGRAIRKLDGMIEQSRRDGGNDEAYNEGLQRQYLALQRSYYEAAHRVSHPQPSEEAAAKVEAYKKAKEALLERLEGAPDEERNAALLELKEDRLGAGRTRTRVTDNDRTKEDRESERSEGR